VPARLYLDTARLGLMSPSAQRIQTDFARLAGEEAGTLYLQHFLQRGFSAWPISLRRRYPALHPWQGVGHLQASLKRLAGASPDSEVLVANRSAELMKLAGILLGGTCRNVLTTDLSWPNYERILHRTARRTGSRVTRVAVRRQILRQGADGRELIDLMCQAFIQHGCDGLFLPAVNNWGVRLPIRELVQAIGSRAELRFVVIDGAQALAHVPLQLDRNYCDLLLAGCHKWLRAYNPLGVAFYGHPRSQSYIQFAVERLLASRRIDDPLLRMTEELVSSRTSQYGETVNLLPLFTCQGAVDDCLHGHDAWDILQQRIANGNRLAEIASESGWSSVRPPDPWRCGISLLRAKNKNHTQMSPERLRQSFHDQGLAVTTYGHDLVRVSLPETPWSAAQRDHLTTAFSACCPKVIGSPWSNRRRRGGPASPDSDLGHSLAFPSPWPGDARSLPD
jgi:selenocysteine lyase/cysteine desulfurase